ncbi:MAG TPA: hypothetical protein PLD47_00720 [Aggregatilineales bacterium]|nr:hypothetical protein [Aggregatilineales bacterium]
MKPIKICLTIAVIGALLFGMAAFPLTASAADDITVTFTEKQINEALAKALKGNKRFSDVVVDLQKGQFHVTATITASGIAYATTSTYETKIVAGRIDLTLTGASVGGQALPESLLAIVNSSVRAVIRTAIRAHLVRLKYGSFWVRSMTISESELTIVVTKTKPR